MRASRGAREYRDYAREVLKESVTILVKTGHSPKQLSQMFRSVIRTLEEPTRPFDPSAIPNITVLLHIVTHWYSDPAYRGRDNQPLKIPLRGRGPSLANLSRRLFPRQDVVAVARALVKANAVQRRGRFYEPTGRYVALTRDLPSVHVYGLMSLAGMLRTVQHNLSSADVGTRLVERAAVNPYIPVRALPEIHRRIKREISAVLFKLDGYLRRWEVEPGSEPTTQLGVGAYAYEDPTHSGSGISQRLPVPTRRRKKAASAWAKPQSHR